MATINRHFPVGIHAGPGGNLTGAGQPEGYWVQLAKAGKKPVVMSVDNYGPILEAQKWCDKYKVEGAFTYRILEKHDIVGWQPDIPAWGHPAVKAGEWQAQNIIASLPPEFDKRTWIQSWNEADKDSHWQTGEGGYSQANADWFGFVAVACAQYLNARGYKMLAFAFSSGEPEILDWYTNGMKAYLHYCAQHLDQAGIALHEYSYEDKLPGANTGLIGRYKHIHEVCDHHSIKHPKIRITEFGWRYNWVPSWQEGITQIVDVVDRYYGNHPNIDSVNLWYSGPGYSKIANKVQPYFKPLEQVALQWSMQIENGETTPPEPPPTEPPPPTDKIDMSKYFLPPPGSNYGPIYMLTNNWGAGPERTQLQRNQQWSYITKNRNWERRFIGKDKIYLQVDTSPNEDEFYTVEADLWMPRYMKPGEAFTRNELTTYYNKNTCIKGTQVNWTSLIKFDKIIDIEEHNLTDVAVLQWIFAGELEETYMFAPHIGLVGWLKNNGNRSWISEFVPTHEQPNERGIWCPAITREIIPEGESNVPPPTEPPVEPPTYPEYPHGLDISKYQGDVDPVEMQDKGIDFCYVRSGQGRYLEDGFYKQNTEAILTYTSILVGTYHMFQPNQDAASQAELWLKLMRETSEQNLPPALDLENLEEFEIPTGDPQVYRDNVKLILEIVEDQTGVKPVIYTNIGWYNKYLAPQGDRFEEYGLWIANWTALGIPSLPAGVATWEFWQYGMVTPGSEYGVNSTAVDANRANFASLNELEMKWSDNWLTRVDEPEPETYPAHRREDYQRTIYLILPDKLRKWEIETICKVAVEKRRSVMFSHDDAGSSANSHNHIIIFGTLNRSQQIYQSDWFKQFYPWAYVTFDNVQNLIAT